MNGLKTTDDEQQKDPKSFLDEFNESLLLDNIYTTMKSLTSGPTEVEYLSWLEIKTLYDLSIISLCIQFASEQDNDRITIKVFNEVLKKQIVNKII